MFYICSVLCNTLWFFKILKRKGHPMVGSLISCIWSHLFHQNISCSSSNESSWMILYGAPLNMCLSDGQTSPHPLLLHRGPYLTIWVRYVLAPLCRSYQVKSWSFIHSSFHCPLSISSFLLIFPSVLLLRLTWKLPRSIFLYQKIFLLHVEILSQLSSIVSMST